MASAHFHRADFACKAAVFAALVVPDGLIVPCGYAVPIPTNGITGRTKNTENRKITIEK